MKLKISKTITYYFLFISAFCTCIKCAYSQEISIKKNASSVLMNNFQKILDNSNVSGAILIYNPQNNTFYSNDFKRCETGYLPASTFKIVNSIIALETGIIDDDSTIFKWDGEKRKLSAWEKDLTFKEAFQVSCVPCFQLVARIIGVEKMKEYLEKFNYGTMLFDSTTIDLFWLEGESKISMYQQIDFLYRFYFSKLSISERTEKIMKKLMIVEENLTYILSGKTGWAIRNNNNTGWFVGYLITNNNVYFIVTNIEPKDKFSMDLFPKIRTEISLKAFKEIKLIE